MIEFPGSRQENNKHTEMRFMIKQIAKKLFSYGALLLLAITMYFAGYSREAGFSIINQAQACGGSYDMCTIECYYGAINFCSQEPWCATWVQLCMAQCYTNHCYNPPPPGGGG